MIFHNKKGLGLLLVIGLAIVFAAMWLIIFSRPVTFEESLGVKQYNVLTVNENIEAALLYLEESLPHALDRAEDSLYLSSGIPSTSFGTGRGFNSPCGTHIYNLYSTQVTTCLPHFRNAFTSYTEQNLKRYADSYTLMTLPSTLFINVISTPAENTIVLARASPYGVPLASKINFVDQEKVYPRGILGGYGSETPVTCGSGECFAQVSTYLVELYEQAGLRLPYVEGGESPYSYEDALADQKENDNSIFADVEITLKQEGRSSFTEAGFDGSGWVWWIGIHASVLDLIERKNIDVLYEAIGSSGNVLCQSDDPQQQDCTFTFLSEELQSGDLVFVEDQGRPIHVMIYVGDNQVTHSRPGIGLRSETLPSEYLSATQSNILSVVRLNYQPGGRTIFLEEADQNTNVTCSVAVDFTQINEESFRTRGILTNTENILNDFEQKIVDSNQADTIALTQEFKRFPEEYIKALIYKESGVDKFAYLTGSQIQSPGNPFYGPMQMGESACTQVAERHPEGSEFHCDWDTLREGGYESARMSILAGAAYLDWLVGASKYIDNDNPDLYFLAVAYNAGPGSLNRIMEAASSRTGIPEVQLQWRDIEYRDVSRAMIALGPAWAKERSKWDEIFEYPNFVNYVLNGYCEGDIFANYRSAQSLMYFQPQLQSSSSLDIVRMSLIENFVDDTLTCDDYLEVCIAEKLEAFNSAHGSSVFISRQGEVESFAYEFADQTLNCLKNEQTNCLCQFDLELESQTTFGPLEEGEEPTFNGPFVSSPREENLLGSAIDGARLSMGSDGIISIGQQSSDGFEEVKKIHEFPLGLSSYYQNGRPDTAFLIPDFTQNQVSLFFDDGTTWDVGGEEITHLTLAKEGDFSFSSDANDRQQAIIEYAEQYLGTGYHINSRDGVLTDCRAEDAKAGRCKTQCGSFVSSVFLYTLGTRDGYGPDIVPRGNGNEKCTRTNNLLEPFTDQNLLRVGDLFSSNGLSPAAQRYGHTGIYVGWGSVENPARTRSDGSAYCYESFNPNPLDGQGDHVFIHSVGPVCYNTLRQLVEEQGRNEMLFCRHKLLENTQAEVQEAEEESLEEASEAPLEWFPYNEESHHQLLCRDNRHYYRFHAQFSNGQEPITFSLYLNDTVAPSIAETDIGLRTCGTRDVVALQWSMPKDGEPIYSFDIQPTCQDECPQNFTVLVSGAQETTITDATDQTTLNQLFVRETPNRFEYSYLINRINGELLEPNSTYSFDILANDHYLNIPESLPQELSVTTPPLTAAELIILTQTEGTILEGFVDDAIREVGSLLGECEDASGFEAGSILGNSGGDLSPFDEDGGDEE